MSIYLDYNASAPIDSRVLDIMIDVYKNHAGNADSRTHDFGDDARSLTEQAREKIAALLGVKRDEIFFTSGATESNNIAILGLKEYGLKNKRKHIITSSIEHKAVLEAAKHLEKDGYEVEFVDPDISGRISVDEVVSKIRPETLLVSVMHVNNETGIIQPVAELGEYLSKTNTLFHIDATQSCGKLVEEIRKLKYNMMSISAHKMHGPQGIGALVLRKKCYRLPPISPIMYGGPQEHGIRPGTLPTALIAGFGMACEIASSEYIKNAQKCLAIKEKLLELLRNSGVNYKLNGEPQWCVPTTINVSFVGVSSEALMLATKQYCGVSNGSACTSSNYSHSHVLTAMKFPDERIESAIRISWAAEVDVDSLVYEFSKMLSVVRELA
jgi:Cysteine sulfinate desulfinase/cysteine desulfurase and related enzymes